MNDTFWAEIGKQGPTFLLLCYLIFETRTSLRALIAEVSKLHRRLAVSFRLVDDDDEKGGPA